VSVAEREAALLAEVARYRERTCAAALAAAHEEAAGYVARAHAEARQRFHAGAQETRRRAAARIRGAEAAVEAVARWRAQEVGRALVARGERLLEAALTARWADPEGRRGWLAWAAGSATARMVATDWVVAHPAGWAKTEWEGATAGLAVAVATPRLVADPQIVAGLRITVAGATVDATVAGILANLARIGGRLLALTRDDREGAE